MPMTSFVYEGLKMYRMLFIVRVGFTHEGKIGSWM
jgi:hypothetical protein